MTDGESQNLTKYFVNDPPSLFDDIAQPVVNLSQTEVEPVSFPDVTHLLEEEIIKPNVSNEVIDFWESPVIASSGVPPPMTLPGMYTSVDYQDYIQEVSIALLGNTEPATKRSNILSENDVTQDDRGLRQLILSGCFRAALNLTSKLLSVYGQGYNKVGQVSKNSPHSLQLWFARLALLLRLGQYDICIREAEAFGKLDRPDVFYENYPDLYPGGRKGSMASFSFRLLIAELPIYKGLLHEAMGNLTELLDVCTRIKSYFEHHTETGSEAVKFWQKRVTRVMHSIINCSILMKNYSLTTGLLKKVIEATEDFEEKKSLELALARVYLQCGDVQSAENCFKNVLVNNNSEDLSIVACINKGIMCMSKAEFAEATNYFQKGLELEPKNIMLHNNLAVCYLYSGRLKDAIKQYEIAIDINPMQALNENLLLNLSTLYELESNDAKNKKLNLLRKISMYKPDLNCSVDVCLKLEYKRPEEMILANKDTYII